MKLVLNKGWFVLGDEVKTFETNFADYCGAKHCIGVGNGLDALVLILKGYIQLGKLQKCDEVIVPANTYIASILAILQADLVPVLVEPRLETYNINPDLIEKKIRRLQKSEPIEYITNKSLFYSLEFYVDKRVLIPRNDTEVLVKKTIKEINKYNDILLIDVGTWSSCIPISIAKNTNLENVIVIDISRKALNVSKKNIIKHNLESKIKQLNSNLLEKLLNKKIKNKNLIITANLPYIKNDDFENMSKETIAFEPSIALFWWEKTGFELYENLINQILSLKNDNNFENII